MVFDGKQKLKPYTIECTNGKKISAFMRDMHGQDYLDVKWRLVWMRTEHPDWGIATECREHVMGQTAAFFARITDGDGRLIATGSKMETKAGFQDYYEKAETGAVGRALLNAGYGTANCGAELDEGERIVDSPVPRMDKPLTSAVQQALGGDVQADKPAEMSDEQKAALKSIAVNLQQRGVALRDDHADAWHAYIKAKWGVDSQKDLTETQLAECIKLAKGTKAALYKALHDAGVSVRGDAT